MYEVRSEVLGCFESFWEISALTFTQYTVKDVGNKSIESLRSPRLINRAIWVRHQPLKLCETSDSYIRNGPGELHHSDFRGSQFSIRRFRFRLNP